MRPTRCGGGTFPHHQPRYFVSLGQTLMGMRRALVVCLIALGSSIGSSKPVVAQSLPLHSVPTITEMPTTISPSTQQMSEIERWTRDYTAWKAWFAEWRNKREPSTFGTRPRRQRPDPPDALFLACPVPSD